MYVHNYHPNIIQLYISIQTDIEKQPFLAKRKSFSEIFGIIEIDIIMVERWLFFKINTSSSIVKKESSSHSEWL